MTPRKLTERQQWAKEVRRRVQDIIRPDLGLHTLTELEAAQRMREAVLSILEDDERESSLGRDAEGHLVLTLGPGAESPSRKEGWDELKGLSPLEQYNREGR